MRRNARVLVSGAGVSGLVSALWLGRNGLCPTVVERSPSIRADGFIVSLSHASYRYAQALDLLEPLRSMETRFAAASYYDDSGRTMLEMDRSGLFDGVDMVQIMRDDLQSVLWAAAEPVAEFRFGTTIASIEQIAGGVGVEFDDGISAEYEVVIGADGLHSNTRTLAFDANHVHRKYLGLFSSAYRLDNVLDLRHRFENHMERSRYMCVYTARGGGLARVFIWKWDAPQAPPPEVRFDTLHRFYRTAPPVVQRVLGECPRDQIIYQDPLIQIELSRWHNGRVVLLGDAAHCLTLLSGQGASSAFWGASALAKALIQLAPEAAFAAYESELRPVVARLQPMTRNAARWYVPHAHLRYFARNSAMRWLPNALFERHFRRKYNKA